MKTIIMMMLAVTLLAKKSHYETLGVSRNFTEKQLKSAYRKLVKKFHPDKNKDRPEWAKKNFMNVQNAYEVLSDPKKRKLYDIGGDENVQEHEQREAQGRGRGRGGGFGDFGDFFGGGGFGDFFGGGGGGGRRRGGGQRFEFNMGGDDFFGGGGQQRGRRQQHKKREKVDLESCDGIIQLTKENAPDFDNLDTVWNVFFYNETSKENNEAKLIKWFGDKYGSHTKIGLVNCTHETELCRDMGVFGVPRFFIHYNKRDKIEVKLHKGLKPEFLVKQNIELMENRVHELDSDNYKDFIKENYGKPIFILFTARKNTGILFLNLANIYKDKVIFAEVHKDDWLVNQFNVNDFPSLMILDDPAKYSGEFYSGPLTKQLIMHFLNDRISKRGSKNKSNDGKIEQLDKEKMKWGTCGAKDKSFCFIALVNNERSLAAYNKILAGLSESYSSDNFSFYYILRKNINKTILANNFQNNSVLILRGKRSKYTGFEEDLLKIEQQVLENKIENIISGSLGSMQKYKDFEKILN